MSSEAFNEIKKIMRDLVNLVTQNEPITLLPQKTLREILELIDKSKKDLMETLNKILGESKIEETNISRLKVTIELALTSAIEIINLIVDAKETDLENLFNEYTDLLNNIKERMQILLNQVEQPTSIESRGYFIEPKKLIIDMKSYYSIAQEAIKTKSITKILEKLGKSLDEFSRLSKKSLYVHLLPKVINITEYLKKLTIKFLSILLTDLIRKTEKTNYQRKILFYLIQILNIILLSLLYAGYYNQILKRKTLEIPRDLFRIFYLELSVHICFITLVFDELETAFKHYLEKIFIAIIYHYIIEEKLILDILEILGTCENLAKDDLIDLLKKTLTKIDPIDHSNKLKLHYLILTLIMLANIPQNRIILVFISNKLQYGLVNIILQKLQLGKNHVEIDREALELILKFIGYSLLIDNPEVLKNITEIRNNFSQFKSKLILSGHSKKYRDLIEKIDEMISPW